MKRRKKSETPKEVTRKFKQFNRGKKEVSNTEHTNITGDKCHWNTSNPNDE